MNGKITLTFHENGTVSVKPEGFVGATCKDATRAFEEALGTTISQEPTEEMYQTAAPAQRATVR